ncbi:MAG TPA: MFS transporter [Desulfuromonadales bacterium]|nr:MFS transporter [Desulfuromonadales bacterium]
MRFASSPKYRWYIFFMCGITYVISGFWRVSTSVMAGDLARDLSLSPEVLGLMGGAFFYSFGMAQLPMGPLLDRFGPRRVISLLVCIGAASAVIFSLAGNGAVAVLARAGIGLGMAAVLMGSLKILTTWFSPREFATLSGTLIAFGNLGGVGATTPLAWLCDRLGWRWACGSMSVITLMLAAGIYIIARDCPPKADGIPSDQPSLAEIRAGLRTVFCSRTFWHLAPLGFASYGALITAQGLWGVPFLMHTYGMNKTSASSVLLAIPVGVVFGAPVWGRWSDKLGKRKPLVTLGLGAMLVLFASLVLHLPLPRWGLSIQCWLLGFSSASLYILYTQVKESFSLSIAGTALTALNFFVIVGAAVFQQLTGFIMGQWQSSITTGLPLAAYQWGFGVSAAILAIALTLYLFSSDTHIESTCE